MRSNFNEQVENLKGTNPDFILGLILFSIYVCKICVCNIVKYEDFNFVDEYYFRKKCKSEQGICI